MNTKIKTIKMLGVTCVAVSALLLAGCEYEVPITSSPTEKINGQLVGNWAAENGTDTMKIRKLDDSTYVVSYNGYLFRAYHSALDGVPFVSIEDLDWASGKYCYRKWSLASDGTRLTLHSINGKLVSRDIKDMVTIQNLLRKNLKNPELFKDEIQFTKKN